MFYSGITIKPYQIYFYFRIFVKYIQIVFLTMKHGNTKTKHGNMPKISKSKFCE